jgi:hypothetical protein
MRSLFAGMIMLSASMAVVDTAQAQIQPQRTARLWSYAGSDRSSAANPV